MVFRINPQGYIWFRNYQAKLQEVEEHYLNPKSFSNMLDEIPNFVLKNIVKHFYDQFCLFNGNLASLIKNDLLD